MFDQGAFPDRRRDRPDERRLMELGRDLVAQLDLETVLERLIEIARDLTGAREAVLVSPDAPDAIAVHPADRARRSSLLTVPIHTHGRAYGTLHLSDKAGGDFDAADEAAVVALAGWAAIAIDNARLYHEEAERRQELERTARRYDAMKEIARAVGGVPDLESVLSVVAERTRSLVEARVVVVNLLDGDELVVSAVAGHDAQGLLGVRIPVEGSLGGYALEQDRVTHLYETPAGLGAGVTARLEPQGALFAPLPFRGRHLGTLVTFDRVTGGPAFGGDDALVVEGIAASAAVGVATAQGVAAHALRRSVAAAERERQRWARNLHDQTLQDLAGLRLTLDALVAGEDPQRSALLLERAARRVRETIAELRNLVSELRPMVLDDLGVGSALRALGERTATLSGTEIPMQLDLAWESGRARGRLAPEIEETIYRVVQESLNNAVKHAAARSIAVEVVERGPAVVVRVADDGIGFAQDFPHDGLGLIGMQERLELVGGELRVFSRPQAGTTVRATIPVVRALRPISAGTRVRSRDRAS